MVKQLLMAIMIVITTGLMGMSEGLSYKFDIKNSNDEDVILNQKILKSLDYTIESKMIGKMEDQEFSQYYNISMAQINMYKVYLNKINYTFRDLDKYLNFRIKKRLFLGKILPLDILKRDSYKTFEEYQSNLFKLLKKREIKNMMSPNEDYRILFVYMLENRLETEFWQNYMIDKDNLANIYYEKNKDKVYNYIAIQKVNLRIKSLGGMEIYGELTRDLLKNIIPRPSGGGDADPLDKIREIPDSWNKGDRIRLSNYLKKKIYDKVVPGDMLVIDNGSSVPGSSGISWPWHLGYFDHAIMVTSKGYETPTDSNITARHNGESLPNDNAFIGAWNKYGVIYEKRYLYQYVYVPELNTNGTDNPNYDYTFERIRKPQSQVITGRIAQYQDGDIRPIWKVTKWAESKIGHDYGIFGPSCSSDEANYTCASLAWCAYKENLNIDIDMNNNGSVYVDDINDYISTYNTQISHIIYDHEYLRAHFKCPKPIDETNPHYTKDKEHYDWAVWNFSCPRNRNQLGHFNPSSQCINDYNKCTLEGRVISPLGDEGQCLLENCGHTDFCEYSKEEGKLDKNALAQYMLNIAGYQFSNQSEAEMISICGDNLFDKDLFPDLSFNGCIGPNITGGTGDQDYVDLIDTNCSKVRTNEFCDKNSPNYSKFGCFMKGFECLMYASAIETECPYLHEIRRYGCDAENTDGLDDIINNYEQRNCSNLTEGDTHYKECKNMSVEILELCPQYIEGNSLMFGGE